MVKRFIIKSVVFLFIAVLLDQAVGIGLESLIDRFLPSSLMPTKIRMRDFYEHKSNIDMLFLGSSHTYNGFDPFIFDDALHVDSFNLGSPGQNPTTTYYVLEEVLRVGHSPRLIVIETYWKTLTSDYTEYESASNVFHNMKFSRTKLAMFWSACEFPSSLKLLSRVVKNRQVTVDCLMLLAKRLLRRKIAETARYAGKGYVEGLSTVSKAELENNEFKNAKYNMNQHRLYFLGKTIDHAKEQGIQVVLVSTPISPTAFVDVQGYEAIYNTIRKTADKHGVEYIDYNMLNSELGMFRDENFMDDDHLNKSGAEILGEHLGKLLVSTYGERLQSLN